MKLVVYLVRRNVMVSGFNQKATCIILSVLERCIETAAILLCAANIDGHAAHGTTLFPDFLLHI